MQLEARLVYGTERSRATRIRGDSISHILSANLLNAHPNAKVSVRETSQWRRCVRVEKYVLHIADLPHVYANATVRTSEKDRGSKVCRVYPTLNVPRLCRLPHRLAHYSTRATWMVAQWVGELSIRQPATIAIVRRTVVDTDTTAI